MGVSLVAVAAVAASMILTRQKPVQAPGEIGTGEPTLPPQQLLDAIRAAGY